VLVATISPMKDLGGSTDVAERGDVSRTPDRPQRLPSKALRRVQLYLLLIIADICAIVAGICIVSLVRLGSPFGDNVADLLTGLLPLYLLLGFYNRAFSLQCLQRWTASVRRASSTLAITMIVVLGMGFALKISADYSRIVLIAGLAAAAVVMVVLRLSVARLTRFMLPGTLVDHLILCDGTMLLPKQGERIINARALGLQPRLDSPLMLDRLGHLLGQADRVVIACAPEARAAWVAATKGLGVSVEVLIPEIEQLGVLGTDSFDGQLTAIIGRGPLSTRDKTLKRLFDLLFCLFLLPALLLMTLAVAIAIKLDDGGPLFFRQTRIGQSNRLFEIYKFRSMRVEQSDSDGKISTARDDSRITRLGKLLRSTSIDELPQFYNVLKGDMSIVGPRPHALASTAGEGLFWEVDERYWVRHAAKPGLTGLAQIRGFRGATANASDLINRVQADLEYLSGWSLWRDAKILAATLRVILHPNAF
jgi:lipopolysaccharide/colanic/teichoic acid biosynthesis glycosyltransferase